MAYAIDIAAVLEASKRITGKVRRTSVVRSDELDKLAGRELFFKCENEQSGGAFKFRGAMNAIICLDEDDHSIISTGESAPTVVVITRWPLPLLQMRLGLKPTS